MNPQIEAMIAAYDATRTTLLSEYPELAEDERTLRDTLEGETELPDACIKTVRSAREDEALAKALKSMMDNMAKRYKRLLALADAKRRVVLSAMDRAGIKRIDAPDLTITTGSSKPSVIITDEGALPDQFVRIKREPDKAALGKALADGVSIPGALLSNGGKHLIVRST